MKKSKINPKEVLKDADKIINIISNLENLDLENLDSLEEEIKKLEKSLSKKYKVQLKEESKDNLDTKE
tara:strand:- start:25 stop:228 length:204 start_codon:yes stop_codon:yes gene_type:complete